MLDQSVAGRHILPMSDVPKLFDTRLRQRRHLRAQALGPWPTFLQQAMLETIADRVSCIARRFSQAILLGDGEPAMWPRLSDAQRVITVAADESLALAARSADMIACAGLLHAANDVPGLLMQMRAALTPDGLMVATFLGGDTLHELRDCLLRAESDITGGAALRVHPMIEVRDGGSLLQRAGFAMPVADLDRLTVTYAHPLDLMRDLRSLGETSVLAGRSRQFLRRDVLLRACDLYIEKYTNDAGRVAATFSLITLSGWSPADNQPQPRARGSTTVSLASVFPVVKPEQT